MPKLSSRPPKPSRHKSGKNEYAVVYIDGKKNNLGRWGSPEAKEAYARFEVEWWENSRRPVAERISRSLPVSRTKTDTTVKEVALQFLQYAEATKSKSNFTDYRIATMDFLVKHYGSVPVRASARIWGIWVYCAIVLIRYNSVMRCFCNNPHSSRSPPMTQIEGQHINGLVDIFKSLPEYRKNLLNVNHKLPPHQNLWVNSGSGSLPRA